MEKKNENKPICHPIGEVFEPRKYHSSDKKADEHSEAPAWKHRVQRGVAIPRDLYDRLQALGIIPNETRDHNVGASDYSQHIIQPWSIWLEYDLNPFDADIIKRVLRTKSTDPRIVDYEKIIHICQERIRQLKQTQK